MTPVYVRAPFWQPVRQFGSWAVMVRPRAETIPLVTVGPPLRARAYPSATTGCPSWRVLESPSGTVGRPVASTFRTARSADGSPPITLAAYRFESGGGVITVTCVAPSTTW